MSNIPPGFKPMDIGSAFILHGGPVYLREGEDGLVFGMRIERHHTNLRGTAHGAAIMLLADVALGFATACSEDPPVHVITSNLSADFATAAQHGDWVEARVDVQKVGSRMAYANTYVTVGDKRLVRASAVFAVEQG